MRDVLYWFKKNVSWNTGDLVKIIGSIVDQSIIRCNYSDKLSYLELKYKCINESKPKCICTKCYRKLPASSSVNHLFRNGMLTRRLSKSPRKDQIITFVHVAFSLFDFVPIWYQFTDLREQIVRCIGLESCFMISA